MSYYFINMVFVQSQVLGLIASVKYLTVGKFEDEKLENNEYGDGDKVYVCPMCGYEFKEKEWMQKCQKWCSEKHSCNLDIIKHGNPPRV